VIDRTMPVETAAGSFKQSSAREYIVGGRYRLIKKIGSGSYGDIYLGINITNWEEVAVKMESCNLNRMNDCT